VFNLPSFTFNSNSTNSFKFQYKWLLSHEPRLYAPWYEFPANAIALVYIPSCSPSVIPITVNPPVSFNDLNLILWIPVLNGLWSKVTWCIEFLDLNLLFVIVKLLLTVSIFL